MSEGLSVPPRAFQFTDRLTIHLERDPVLLVDDEELRGRVRRELVQIRDALLDAFPDASMVIMGSLYAGEGQAERVGDRMALRSDYDLCVITPHLLQALPWRAAPLMRSRLDPMGLSARVEIGVVWKRLLEQRCTTLGGAFIGGDRSAEALLPSLPAPRPFSAKLQAYRSLSLAPVQPGLYAYHAAKAMMRAAYVFLLGRMGGRDRSSWVALCSVRHVAQCLRRPEYGWSSPLLDAVDQARDVVLGVRSDAPMLSSMPVLARWVAELTSDIPATPSATAAIKHAFWLIRERRLGVPRPDAGLLCADGLQALAEAWRASLPDPQAIAKARRAATRLCRYRPAASPDPLQAYAEVRGLLSSLAGFNPHRISFGSSAYAV